ncbi:MAG: serine hydrolase, partial [Dokdonella sp.]
MRSASVFASLAGLLALLSLPTRGADPLMADANASGAPAVSEAPAAATPSTTPGLTETDATAWLDGFLPYAIGRADIPGAVVVVVKDGKILVEKGYGFADVA